MIYFIQISHVRKVLYCLDLQIKKKKARLNASCKTPLPRTPCWITGKITNIFHQYDIEKKQFKGANSTSSVEVNVFKNTVNRIFILIYFSTQTT